MSAAPLLAPPTMPTMISRLPKFGSRPKSQTHPAPLPVPVGGSARLTNGFYHHPGPAGVNGAVAPKQNGFLRAPSSLAGRWRDDGGSSHSPSQRDARKATLTGKGRGFTAAASPRTVPTSSAKPTGVLGSKPWSLARPGSGTGSRTRSPLLKKPPAGRCFSSDGLGSAPPGSAQLTERDRLRSRSLTQVQRQPSPSGGASGVRGARTILPPSASKKPLLPTLSSASKPISYRLSRPSLIKQPRPLSAPSSNDRVAAELRSSMEAASTVDNGPETSPEAPESPGLSAELLSQEEGSVVGDTLQEMSLSSSSSMEAEHTSQEYMDDTLANGSVGLLLLSANQDEDDSGLDRSCPMLNTDQLSPHLVTKATGLCFLDEAADWTAGMLPGERRLSGRRSHHDDQEQPPSSLDLSPSDSCGSAGTYMWDEEGLEPLGGALACCCTSSSSVLTGSTASSRHRGSYDSDLNSIDLLNQLDSCDLTEDDLMLDADLPEESSLHSETEVLELCYMAQWRKRQLCWETHDNQRDHHGNHLREDPGNERSENDELSPAPLTPPTALGVDVEELAEECSAVRFQLEHLQRFLLQEEDTDDDTLTTDTLSPETIDSTCSSDSQVEALLQEVQQLRQELRSRDRTIAQLTVQLTVPMGTSRCHCQPSTNQKKDQFTQTSVTERESVCSQTPWREHRPQVLHSSSPDQEPLTQQAPPPAVRLLTSADGGKQSPLPSKLRLFSPVVSGPAPSPPPPRASRLRAPSSSVLSRLPKPKSH